MLGVGEVARILAQVREEALPDGLHEVHRVELGPQLLGSRARTIICTSRSNRARNSRIAAGSSIWPASSAR